MYKHLTPDLDLWGEGGLELHKILKETQQYMYQ